MAYYIGRGLARGIPLEKEKLEALVRKIREFPEDFREEIKRGASDELKEKHLSVYGAADYLETIEMARPEKLVEFENAFANVGHFKLAMDVARKIGTPEALRRVDLYKKAIKIAEELAYEQPEAPRVR